MKRCVLYLSVLGSLCLLFSTLAVAGSIVYDNGPVNLQPNGSGWSISGSSQVSDTFIVPAGSNFGGIEFWVWLGAGQPEDVLTYVEVSVTDTLDNPLFHRVLGVAQLGCIEGLPFKACLEYAPFNTQVNAGYSGGGEPRGGLADTAACDYQQQSWRRLLG